MTLYASFIMPFSYNAAIPGKDYEDVERQELVFNSNISVLCTPVYVLDDTLLESTENIVFVLRPTLEDIPVVNFTYQQASVQIIEDTIDGKCHLQVLIIIDVIISITLSSPQYRSLSWLNPRAVSSPRRRRCGASVC